MGSRPGEPNRKYPELHDAIVAMAVDAPPLKWTAPDGTKLGALRAAASMYASRHGVELRTFIYRHTLYMVRVR